MMTALYLLQAFGVAGALATAAICYGSTCGLRLLPRTLIAIALTPLVLALLTLLVAWCWPGAPRGAFLLAPLVLSLLVISLLGHAVVERASPALRDFRVRKDPRQALAAISCAAIAAFVTWKLAIAASGIPIGHDALIYLAEAKGFAQERTIAAIPTFDGAPGRLVKVHPHQFVFQAYLAQALMAGSGTIGYPDDAVARAAMQIPFLLMGMGAAGVALAVAPVWTAGFAVALTCLVGQIDYIIRAFSVDAFRMLPLLALIALLIAAVRQRLGISRILLIGAMAGLTGLAHAFNMILLVLIGASLALACAVRLIRVRSLIAIYLAMAVFLMPAAYYYVSNYIDYGHPLGYGLHYFFYRDSPLWEAFSKQEHWMKLEGPLAALLKLWSQFGILVSVAAVMAAIAGAVMARFIPSARRLAFLGGLFLVLMLGLLVPVGGRVSLQGAMLSNFRYGLPIYVIGAVVIAAALAILLKACSRRIQLQRPAQLATAAAIAIAITATSIHVVRSWHVYDYASSSAYTAKNEAFIARLVDSLQPGSNWVTDRYTTAYFTARPPVFLYSKLGSPLIRAKSANEVNDLIAAMNIRAVALYDDAPDWWPATALYRTLAARPDVKRVNSATWQVFLIRSAKE